MFKKSIIATLLVILCLTASAKVKVTGGSAACLRQQVKATLLFDYAEATFDKDQSYALWCGENYEERVVKSSQEFTTAFNKKSKGMQIVDNESEAAYKIVVHVKDCDQNMGMDCNWGQMVFKCSASVEIVEVASGQVVCTIEVKEHKGSCDYTPLDRIAKCFGEVGKAIAKTK